MFQINRAACSPIMAGIRFGSIAEVILLVPREFTDQFWRESVNERGGTSGNHYLKDYS